MRIFFLLVACSAPALAVLPGLMGPIQALVAMLPQLFAVFLGLFGSLLSMSYWRDKARRHIRALVVMGLLALGLVWLGTDHRQAVVATPTPRASSRPRLSGQSWTSFRGQWEGGGGGALGQQGLDSKPEILWSHQNPDEGSQYLSSPVALNERVYVGLSLITRLQAVGSMECLDAADGSLLWRCLTPHPVFSSPVVANGRFYCGEGLHENEDCKMYCLEADTGKTLWTFATHGHCEGTPTLVEERLIFSAGGDGLYCVEARSGKKLWHSLCGHCDSSAAVAQGRVFVGTAYGDNSTVCLDLKTGKTLWKVPQNLPVWGHASVAGERVFFGLGNGTFGTSAERPAGAILCLQASTGKLVWRREVGDSVNTSLCLSQGHLLGGSRDGSVYCMSQQDGQLLWKSYCGKPVLASLVLIGDEVLVAGGDGRLHALDRATGKELWAYLVADVPCESSPMLNHGRLYLGGGASLQCLGH